MSRISINTLRRFVSGGNISSSQCLQSRCTASFLAAHRSVRGARTLHSDSVIAETKPVVPLRKQLKDEARLRKLSAEERRASASNAGSNADSDALRRWQLTVGIEIHAQLNTARKLFSPAASTVNEVPNSRVAQFDLSMPGTLPAFQKATLIPAIRAALALNCKIQRYSRFDRKHYFHWDQPAGYQITQYYHPFAVDGYVDLYAHDGIAKEDGDHIRVGIKQVQMEQDTAKTVAQPGGVQLLDFNRVGLPLIEIITLPQLHHPRTAAALVRKVQGVLNAVDACVLGMQSGGLRADVNVSVRRKDDHEAGAGLEYGGVGGLGQRTEIKNLSSFKAVEDAIVAERDRQTRVLEDGGVIEGETRGWKLGSSETKRLRGKEGEVDYRYMPDADLLPVIIGEDLIQHLRATMGVLPDAEFADMINEYGLSEADASSLLSLDDGNRAEYFYNVVDEYCMLLAPENEIDRKSVGANCSKWVLHELGALVDTTQETNGLHLDADSGCAVSARQMAELIFYSDRKQITRTTAKRLLASALEDGREGRSREVQAMIDENDLWLRPMSADEYDQLARSVLEEDVVEQILRGKSGKIMYFVGKMMRGGEEGRVEPKEAEKSIRCIIEGLRK